MTSTNQATAEDRIEAGEPVYMMFTRAGRVWWLEEPYEELDRTTIGRLGNRLIESGDSLFGWRGYSQTWRAARD
ncbi:hypothetical protein KHC28_00525 [Ancylobacter sonchi]|uniref:hypothetical protein n=1 Tax=Ancylobacter sonchi TaxID=1937790 RepID=UPI001BD37848|nr:hypothetical protein [Ancylobacter sonchi]MBS7532150.1 hypothetical protein [Ancylobacter sonchi]